VSPVPPERYPPILPPPRCWIFPVSRCRVSSRSACAHTEPPRSGFRSCTSYPAKRTVVISRQICKPSGIGDEAAVGCDLSSATSSIFSACRAPRKAAFAPFASFIIASIHSACFRGMYEFDNPSLELLRDTLSVLSINY